MYAIKSVVENRLSHGIQSDTETGRQGGSARCGTWQVRVPRGYRCSRSVLCCAVLGWASCPRIPQPLRIVSTWFTLYIPAPLSTDLCCYLSMYVSIGPRIKSSSRQRSTRALPQHKRLPQCTWSGPWTRG